MLSSERVLSDKGFDPGFAPLAHSVEERVVVSVGEGDGSAEHN